MVAEALRALRWFGLAYGVVFAALVLGGHVPADGALRWRGRSSC